VGRGGAVQDAVGDGFEGAGGGGAGMGKDHGFLAAHGAHDIFVGGEVAEILDVELEESPDDGA